MKSPNGCGKPSQYTSPLGVQHRAANIPSGTSPGRIPQREVADRTQKAAASSSRTTTAARQVWLASHWPLSPSPRPCRCLRHSSNQTRGLGTARRWQGTREAAARGRCPAQARQATHPAPGHTAKSMCPRFADFAAERGRPTGRGGARAIARRNGRAGGTSAGSCSATAIVAGSGTCGAAASSGRLLLRYSRAGSRSASLLYTTTASAAIRDRGAYSVFFAINLPAAISHSFISVPVATNTLNECRTARALKSLAIVAAAASASRFADPSSPPLPLSPDVVPDCDRARDVVPCVGPSMMRATVSTLGTRRLTARERERTYLCNNAYSRAEMV